MNSRLPAFGLAFVVLFLLTYGFLALMDALPEPLQSRSEYGGQEITTPPATPEAPVRVVAKDIELDEPVETPSSNEIKVLDEALLRGAVHYPTSAPLGVDGTALLFGHSSYLPIVHNQNYKAFNSIQNLEIGAVVSVYSPTAEYRYSVVSVREADATEDVIELPTTGKHIILVTCDSFGKKSDRFVVTADFIGAYTL